MAVLAVFASKHGLGKISEERGMTLVIQKPEAQGLLGVCIYLPGSAQSRENAILALAINERTSGSVITGQKTC